MESDNSDAAIKQKRRNVSGHEQCSNHNCIGPPLACERCRKDRIITMYGYGAFLPAEFKITNPKPGEPSIKKRRKYPYAIRLHKIRNKSIEMKG